MRLDMEAALLRLGLILGPMLEENFRRATLLSRGDFSCFVTRLISATVLGLIVAAMVWQRVAFIQATRRQRARSGLAATAELPAQVCKPARATSVNRPLAAPLLVSRLT